MKTSRILQQGIATKRVSPAAVLGWLRVTYRSEAGLLHVVVHLSFRSKTKCLKMEVYQNKSQRVKLK